MGERSKMRSPIQKTLPHTKKMNIIAPTSNQAAFRVKNFTTEKLIKFFGSDSEIIKFERSNPFLERFETPSGENGLIANWNFSILARHFFMDDFSEYQSRIKSSDSIELSDPAIYPHDEQIEICLIISAKIEKE